MLSFALLAASSAAFKAFSEASGPLLHGLFDRPSHRVHALRHGLDFLAPALTIPDAFGMTSSRAALLFSLGLSTPMYSS